MYAHILLGLVLIISGSSFAQETTDIGSAVVGSPVVFEILPGETGILIPQIDFEDLPENPTNGHLVYVINNGPDGNNAFYYYNGDFWNMLGTVKEPQQIQITTKGGVSNSGSVTQPVISSTSLFSHIPDHTDEIEPVTIDITAPGYTVPPGKNLYIKNFFPRIHFKGLLTFSAPTYYYIFTEGDVIDCGGDSPCHAQGFLLRKRTELVFLDLSIAHSYQVPAGKNFVIYQSQIDNYEFYVDGVRIYAIAQDGIFGEGQVVSWPAANTGFIWGYLLDR